MKKIVILVMLLITSFTYLPAEVSANESAQSSFSVQAVLPDNQTSEATYFDLEMETAQEQALEVRIFNSSDHPIQVLVAANPGITNRNGLITYTGNGEGLHSSSPFTFDSVVEVPESIIEIPANSEEIAIVNVKTPADSFDGTILGGLHFSLAPSESTDGEGFTIRNEFTYVIGLKVTEKDNQTEVEPKLKLNKVEAETSFGEKGARLYFENLTPLLMLNLEWKAELYAAGHPETIVASKEIADFDVAPNYDFSVLFEFGTEVLAAGEYQIKVSFKDEAQNWEFEEAFMVTE